MPEAFGGQGENMATLGLAGRGLLVFLGVAKARWASRAMPGQENLEALATAFRPRSAARDGSVRSLPIASAMCDGS